MAPDTTRRGFLKLAGVATGAMTIGPQVVSAEEAENRFVVDTTSASSDAWRSNVEIVHDIAAIDIAVVKGEEGEISHLEYDNDIELELDIPAQNLPDADEPENSETDADGAPTIPEPNPEQWDKRYQGVHSLHEDGVTGEGARVAVIDTGVARNHPALDSNVDVDASKNFTSDGYGAARPYGGYHGTHCAGIIASDGASSYVGTAPRAEIVDCRVFPAGDSLAYDSDILAGIAYAANPEGGDCDVANLSLGAYPSLASVSTELSQLAYERAAAYAGEQGTLVVAAAGNDDTNLDADGDVISLPNEADNFVSVSATGPLEYDPETGDSSYSEVTPASYTNYGADAVDISAEGGNSATPADYVYNAVSQPVFDGDTYLGAAHIFGGIAGTSMAAPQVCGAAALVYAENPDVSPDEVRTHLLDTANHVVDADYSDVPFFGDTNGQNYTDGELEDAYDSATYRGNGHLDVSVAATQTVMPAIEFRGETYVPRDLDGDGKYEDVNGDGVFDTRDVQLLYQLLFRPESVSLTAAHQEGLDFDDDGELTQGDVQALVDLMYE